jgi:hypothetical protein
VEIRPGNPDCQEDTHHSFWPLSRSGRDATSALAEKSRGFEFGKIAGSPEFKSKFKPLKIAEVIAGNMGIEIEIDWGLAEHPGSISFLPR